MKKTFSLTDPKKKPERIADAIKFEVKKYMKRERNKELPSKVDYWDFDCRIGLEESVAEVVQIKEIGKHIDQYVSESRETFYLEILAKYGYKIPHEKSKPTEK